MKTTIITLTVVLALGMVSKVTNIRMPEPVETEYTELQEFAVSCFDDTGVYEVYYVAPEPAAYAEEVKMCDTPSIHGKFIN